MRKKTDYRVIAENELSAGERDRLNGRQSSAAAARDRHAALVAWAKRDRQGFETLARWVVATCRVGREVEASDSLTAAGIECWCPRERLRARPRRRLQAVDIFRPIFRGYIFVRVIPDRYSYAGLLSAARLRGLMCDGGRPYLMPPALMERLMLAALERERKQEDSENLPPLPELVGKRVTIRSGPFAEFAVTVRRLLSKRRQVVVEIPIFGAMKEVPLDVDLIHL